MKVTIQSLPKSWWSTYTEALLNSRGQKTESQIWRESMQLQSELLREIEKHLWGTRAA